MAYAIDTAAAISELEEAGVEPTAARCIVRIVAASDDEQATKSDLNAAVATLHAEITTVRSALESEIAAVRSSLETETATLRGEIAAVLSSLEKENANLRGEIVNVRTSLAERMRTQEARITMRIIAAQVATALLLFAAQRFFG